VARAIFLPGGGRSNFFLQQFLGALGEGQGDEAPGLICIDSDKWTVHRTAGRRSHLSTFWPELSSVMPRDTPSPTG
jgi:hypothetical protein